MKKSLIMLPIFIMLFMPFAGMSQELEQGVVLKNTPKVKLGNEVLFEKKLDIIKGKKVALITNPTGVDGHLRATVDKLAACKDTKLIALFGPEHGIRGGVQGDIADDVDKKTGIKTYSLYGKTHRPTDESLKDVDVLLFDIQDIGSRTYTFISTMANCMEEAAKRKIKFVVLDRPNPVNGLIVDGNVLDPKFKSGIGIGPIAYMHGMTVGELAKYFNQEWNMKCDLEVIEMEGWTRDMTWRDTGLLWVPTSPHIPESDTAWFYPITGIFGETPLVNIGVGYTLPFKLVGAPWMDAIAVSKALNDKKIPGVYFEPFFFKPYYMHYEKQDCEGFRVVITDEAKIKPVTVGYYITEVLCKMYPQEFSFTNPKTAKRLDMYDKSNGTDQIRIMQEKGTPTEQIIASYQKDVDEFMKKREKYLIYK